MAVTTPMPADERPVLWNRQTEYCKHLQMPQPALPKKYQLKYELTGVCPIFAIPEKLITENKSL
jgi:hypothetical protein